MNEIFPESARELHKYIANRINAVYETKEAENISKILLTDLFGVHRNAIILNEKIVLDEAAVNRLEEIIGRLLNHEPIQHVVGKAYFYGRTFSVNRHVLIPRPETEELVDWIKKEAKSGSTILDVGAGSGCIAISLALEIPSAAVDAFEISANALDIARKNAAENGARVNFMLQDILKLDSLPYKYDVVVSNPPYIPASEIEAMRKNVVEYEPHEALFVADQDALIFYRKIADLAAEYLQAGGLLFFEIHEGMAQPIRRMLMERGFIDIDIKKDLQGKDRMIKAQIGSQITKL